MAETFPQARLEVLYGPTETTIFCTSVEVSEPEDESRFLIGRPLHNINILVCDNYQNPLPIGLAGEICIGGAGVARGYLNQEMMTREKFVSIEGRRYYRSGDRGRYLLDGRIEFLGRIDNQVKIRGFRVEPGEVEAAIASHSAVHEAVVVAQADKTSGQRLVAYVVPNQDREDQFRIKELKEYLQRRLPAYMLPAAFVLIDEIPITPNGKVDRRALPALDQGSTGRKCEYVAPRTAVEKSVAAIYAQVLELEQVGRLDNFFDIGGHSLLATQVISRIREVFEIELLLRNVFEFSTVAELSEVIEVAIQAKEQEGLSRAPEIIPLNRDAYRI